MLRGLGLGVIVAEIALIIGRLSVDASRSARFIALFDGLVLLTTVLMMLRTARREPSPLEAQAWGVAIGSLIQLDTLATVYIKQSPTDLLYCPFLLLLASVLLSSRRMLLGFTALITLSTVATALHVSPGRVAAFELIAPIAIAALTGIVVFIGRVRSMQRIEQLRLRDRKLAALLQDTLTTLEQRVEQQRTAEEQRRSMEDRLRQSHQLESLGVLAGGVAHDMNNILSIITSVASRAQAELPRHDPLNEDLEYILSAARRGAAFTRNLLGFTARRPQRRERVSMHRLLKEVVRLVTSTLPAHVTISLELSATDDIVIGDDGQLSQAILNLCLNAIDAMPQGGKITVSTFDGRASMVPVPKSLEDLREETVQALIVCVADEGVGMDAPARSRALEPFFSTKEGAHSGLGMSITYGCVVSHGGTMEIDSEPGKGTTITLSFPVVSGDAPTSRRPSNRPAPTTPEKQTVLVVDDEPVLRNSACRLVRSLGMEAIAAGDGLEAIQEFKRRPGQIDIVLLDLTMPGMNGVDCFHQLRALAPELPILLTSGFSKVGSPEALLELPHVGFLPKPYERQDLARAIEETLADVGRAE